uniref:Uncharacterized protein n=1 Tax=mine drainage metagenome TaxID=410659 RepID=E6QJ97_9ZZZZ
MQASDCKACPHMVPQGLSLIEWDLQPAELVYKHGTIRENRSSIKPANPLILGWPIAHCWL